METLTIYLASTLFERAERVDVTGLAQSKRKMAIGVANVTIQLLNIDTDEVLAQNGDG